jgi:hypothetical protein
MRRIHEVEIEILGVDVAFVPLKALQHCIDLAGAVWTSSALDPCFVPERSESYLRPKRLLFALFPDRDCRANWGVDFACI